LIDDRDPSHEVLHPAGRFHGLAGIISGPGKPGNPKQVRKWLASMTLRDSAA
jgi:hypothetical protein